MKNVLKTAEFWTAIITGVIGIAIGGKWLTPEQGSVIQSNISQIIGGVIAIAGALGFMAARTSAKIAVFKAAVDAELYGKGGETGDAKAAAAASDRVVVIARQLGL